MSLVPLLLVLDTINAIVVFLSVFYVFDYFMQMEAYRLLFPRGGEGIYSCRAPK